MPRARFRHCPLLVAGTGALVGCSSLLGLGPFEKVSCVDQCAQASAGAPNAGTGTGGDAGAPDRAGSDTGGTGETAGKSGAGGNGGAANPGLYLIDDFSDCDSNIIEFDGRKGAWFNVTSMPQYAALTFGTPPSAGWTDNTCGAFLTGMCDTCTVIGFGVALTASTYDLSRFSGFRFTYETQSSLFVSVEATNGQTKTYATAPAIAPTHTESLATVLFSNMNPDLGFAGFSKADAIRFELADKAGGFGVGIHRLELLP